MNVKGFWGFGARASGTWGPQGHQGFRIYLESREHANFRGGRLLGSAAERAPTTSDACRALDKF